MENEGKAAKKKKSPNSKREEVLSEGKGGVDKEDAREGVIK